MSNLYNSHKKIIMTLVLHIHMSKPILGIWIFGNHSDSNTWKSEYALDQIIVLIISPLN